MADLHPGLYERLLTHDLAARLARLPAELRAEIDAVDPADVPHVLARYVHDTLVRGLQSVTGNERLRGQVELTNRLLALLAETPAVDPDDQVTDGPEHLLSVWRRTVEGARGPRVHRSVEPRRR